MGQRSSSHSSSDEFWLAKRESPPQAGAASCPSPAALHPGCQGCWGSDFRQSSQALQHSLVSLPAQRGAGDGHLIRAGCCGAGGTRDALQKQAACKLEHC